MKQTQIRSFVERYLKANDCQMIEATDEMIEAQLSVEVDQDLLNRPMYWMYVKTMQLPPNPVRFRFYFTETAERQSMYSDYLFYGSPRFTRMLDSAQKQGRFVRLYQKPSAKDRIRNRFHGYDPMLAIHFRISYICDQKKQRMVYLAFNLHTGELSENFYMWAKNQHWTPQIPSEHFIKPQRIPFAEAVGECEYYLQEQLEQEDQSWAKAANQRLAEECKRIEQYYPAQETITAEEQQAKTQHLRETIWQYQPRIEIDVINAGLFYIYPYKN